MCTNGINAGQLEQTIDQLDDHVAVEYRWAHKLAHSAEDAG
ncbi:MAG: dynein gamma chain protein, partial [Actinobacteria bacterium]|nr:dynein gamma chain protein [Actinomycetota bacterium]